MTRPWPDPSLLLPETDQAQAGSLVFFRPGRYVLKDSLHFAYKQDLFLLGLDRPEIFVSSGKAVVHLEHVQRARLEGLYMNHHRAAVSFYAEVASECGAFMLDPRLHDSTVLELDGGSGISVVNSELEGSGFIGIRAENTRKLRLIDSIIHDTVSYAIELTASDARLQNTLLYDVGRSSFHTYDNSYDDGPCYGPRKSVYVHWLISGQWRDVRHGWTNEANKCLVGGYSGWGWTVPPQPVKVFNTAVRVTDGSTLEIEKSTVHVPQPFPSSHFAEVGAQSSIQVSKSLISAGTRDSKLISDGTLSITDSCLQVSTSDAGNVAGWKPNFLSPPEGVTFDSALTLGDVCIKRGAKLANGRIRPTKKP